MQRLQTQIIALGALLLVGEPSLSYTQVDTEPVEIRTIWANPSPKMPPEPPPPPAPAPEEPITAKKTFKEAHPVAYRRLKKGRVACHFALPIVQCVGGISQFILLFL